VEEFSSSSDSTCLVLSSGFMNVSGAGMKKALKKEKKMIVIIIIIIII
jgi:peptidyl-tRNA hydrolase